MKTREEIEELKRQWKNDPCWDIEDSEGFEQHRPELMDYRFMMEEHWNRKEMERKWARADLLGCSPALLQYIEGLEGRLETLESKVL